MCSLTDLSFQYVKHSLYLLLCCIDVVYLGCVVNMHKKQN
jgi:hypothetical protein